MQVALPGQVGWRPGRTGAALDAEARLEVDGPLDARSAHPGDPVAEVVPVPDERVAAGRAAHLQVVAPQPLVAVRVRRYDDQPLPQVGDRGRVAVAVVHP